MINFSPNFSGHIVVENMKGNELFRKEINSTDQIREFIQANGESTPYHSILKACFIPIRTQNWPILAKDLFLPTFINRALKIDNVALRVFASCFSIILDLMTLIPRLITTPFRISYNNKQNRNNHPLLRVVNIDLDSLDSKEIEKNSLLKIKVNFKRTIIEQNTFKFARVGTGNGFCLVSIDGFHEVKKTPEFRLFRIDTDDYLEHNGEWVKQASSGGETNQIEQFV